MALVGIYHSPMLKINESSNDICKLDANFFDDENLRYFIWMLKKANI